MPRTDSGIKALGVSNSVSNAAQVFGQNASRGSDLLQHQRVVIVGAGCFGLSTAYHLLMRGYTDITVLDRSTALPASDASSNDINRSKCPLSSNHIYLCFAIKMDH
jgi:glutamyl-tRNA reductase